MAEVLAEPLLNKVLGSQSSAGILTALTATLDKEIWGETKTVTVTSKKSGATTTTTTKKSITNGTIAVILGTVALYEIGVAAAGAIKGAENIIDPFNQYQSYIQQLLSGEKPTTSAPNSLMASMSVHGAAAINSLAAFIPSIKTRLQTAGAQK